ncbi:SCO4225 family membrane protein [Spirilliplanes yamanashiensis]|uniref:Uncharacterized protein n=1 Tax=Spirilliplanes yamanashiensis TaxID=42233 RepID=A0A8J3Y6I7_9ACTN|nr:hypothetical protein [Spirilliplanes yamanashiensis]MDP9815047.1 hypothetical protein [Spirilliplanes yamanashiensis]GIJ02703.1 hypothetical protein Sya03_20550 [Spirilliplanes yamanashiensis]
MTALRRTAALAVGNWLSRTYLIGVALVVLWVVWLSATGDGSGDANLAGVWPILVTLPGSYLGVALTVAADGAGAMPFLVVGLTFGALLNAVVLGMMARTVREYRARRRTA